MASFAKLIQENPEKYPARMGQPWTEEEIAKLAAEVAEKKTFETIANEHQRTVGGVVAYLKNMAYHNHKAGKTVEEIVEMTGLNEKQIFKAIEKRETPLSEKKVRKAEKAAAVAAAVTSSSNSAELEALKSDVSELKQNMKDILALLKAAASSS
jgi:hypothetical protein